MSHFLQEEFLPQIHNTPLIIALHSHEKKEDPTSTLPNHGEGIRIPIPSMSCQYPIVSPSVMEKRIQEVVRGMNTVQQLHVDLFQLLESILVSTTHPMEERKKQISHNQEYKKDDWEDSTEEDTETQMSVLLTRFSKADQAYITTTIEEIRFRYASLVESMADIVLSMRWIELQTNTRIHGQDPFLPLPSQTVFTTLVERFMKQRLGVQLLCDHYMALSGKNNFMLPKPTGIVSVDCSFLDILQDAIQEATCICDANYGTVSDVISSIPLPTKIKYHTRRTEDGEENSSFFCITVIRPWVHHALVELLKNAIVSSIHKINSNTASNSQPPDIFILVHEDDNYLTCDIIDQGIGFTSHQQESHNKQNLQSMTHKKNNINEDDIQRCIRKAFEFTHSNSSTSRWDRLIEQQSYAMVRSPANSLGVGLSVSRWMMRMFGSDIQLSHRSQGDILTLWKNKDRKDEVDSYYYHHYLSSSRQSDLSNRGQDNHTQEDEQVFRKCMLDDGCTATLLLNKDSTHIEWDSDYDTITLKQ